MLIFKAMEISEALKEVQERIHNSAVKSGRDSANIKLVAVSKTVELHRVIEAVKAGASIFGENRVQEAKNKITELRTCLPDRQAQNTDFLKIEWHLIGNLQRNKAKTAGRLFHLIHSVDSSALAEELDKHARITVKKQRILVQVKLSGELSKHGISEENLIELLEEISGMNNLQLEGLMTIPPFHEDPEKTRPYFSRLRQLAEMAYKKGFPVNELSMGMSHDFETAIEEGATIVRIGTALFGERKLHG